MEVLDIDIRKVVHIIVGLALTLYPFSPIVAPMLAVLFVTLKGVSLYELSYNGNVNVCGYYDIVCTPCILWTIMLNKISESESTLKTESLHNTSFVGTGSGRLQGWHHDNFRFQYMNTAEKWVHFEADSFPASQ